MTLPELFANTTAPIATLAAAVTDTTGTTITTSAAAPAALQAAGQFRIVIDSEVMLVTGGASTTTWTVQRGVETALNAGVAATHLNGASIDHDLTAGALSAKFPALDANGRVASSVLPQLAWTAVTLPGTITALAGFWTPSSAPDGRGAALLSGAVTWTLANSPIAGGTIFTLPSSAWPTTAVRLQVAPTGGTTPQYVNISTSGVVTAVSGFGSSAGNLYLDGLSFRIA